VASHGVGLFTTRTMRHPMNRHELTSADTAPSSDPCASFRPAGGERLVRLPAVLELTGRGRTAWLDDVKAGKAPKCIKIGAASFWLWTEVQSYIADRIRESRGA
jgi:predicted DNA-binding transcriptional regulator AlpA